MRFRLLDGTEVVGRSYDDVVAAMSADKLVEPRNLATYRRATSRRAHDMYEVEVRYDTSYFFVRDLEAVGLLERVL